MPSKSSQTAGRAKKARAKAVAAKSSASPVLFTARRAGSVVYQGTDAPAMEAIMQPGDIVSTPDGQRAQYQGFAGGQIHAEGLPGSSCTVRGSSYTALERAGPTQEFKVDGDIAFAINIETSEAPRATNRMNRFEVPAAQLLRIQSGRPEWGSTGRELSDDELQSPGFHGSPMQLRADRDAEVTEKSYHSDKEYFTIQEVIANIVDFEMARRPKTNWFGGLDAHHVYFEGMFPSADGASFNIWWGS